jgi:hypothetical protein
MSRTKTVHLLAPVSPPCFSTRSQWLEYLTHAAMYQRPGHDGPLQGKGDSTVFNSNFNFCHDCTLAHRSAMVRAERCRPGHLLKVAAPPAAEPAPSEAVAVVVLLTPADAERAG